QPLAKLAEAAGIAEGDASSGKLIENSAERVDVAAWIAAHSQHLLRRHVDPVTDLLAEELRFPVGNWVYMAPEQVLGVRCDPRSDIYSLGGILYELATGRVPFGNPRSFGQLRQRLYRSPVPPRALVASTPAWLQEIILHCLEIDARNRYASAAEVAFDLANPDEVALTERGLRTRRGSWRMLIRR